MKYLIVLGGAGVGGALRHGVNVVALRLGLAAFPVATLSVNVAGSFMMGLIAEYFALKGDLPQSWRLFLTTGVLGGFTTFSAFSLEVVALHERSESGAALSYALASVVLSVAALFGALSIVRQVVRV